MTLFRKREPDLGDLAAYIVETARGRSVTVNHGRLVLLLYLVDVERVRSRRRAGHRDRLGAGQKRADGRRARRDAESAHRA